MDLIPVYIVVTFLIIFALLIILRKSKQAKDTDDDENKINNTQSQDNKQSASDLYKGYIANTYILEAQPDFIASLTFNHSKAKHYFELDYYRSLALPKNKVDKQEVEDYIFKYKGFKFYASKLKETDPRLITDWQEFKTWTADNSKTVKWYDQERKNIEDFRCLGFFMSLPLNTVWVKMEIINKDNETKFAYAHLIP